MTVLRLNSCGLGAWGGGRALAETLRLNTTVTSLALYYNGLGEVGGRALAEALRLNTTLASLDLSGFNDLKEEVQSALDQAWGEWGGTIERPLFQLSGLDCLPLRLLRFLWSPGLAETRPT